MGTYAVGGFAVDGLGTAVDRASARGVAGGLWHATISQHDSQEWVATVDLAGSKQAGWDAGHARTTSLLPTAAVEQLPLQQRLPLVHTEADDWHVPLSQHVPVLQPGEHVHEVAA